MTDDDWHAAIACIAKAHAPRPLNQLVLMDRQSLESSATISLRALTEAGWRVVRWDVADQDAEARHLTATEQRVMNAALRRSVRITHRGDPPPAGVWHAEVAGQERLAATLDEAGRIAEGLAVVATRRASGTNA